MVGWLKLGPTDSDASYCRTNSFTSGFAKRSCSSTCACDGDGEPANPNPWPSRWPQDEVWAF